MRELRFWLLGLFLVLSGVGFSKSRLEIRDFLGGYSEKTADGDVFRRGMGIENPSLVELMSLSYGALSTIEDRLSDLRSELQKKDLDPKKREVLQKILKRTETQCWLGWEIFKEFVKESMWDFDLRGFAKLNPNIVDHESKDKDEAKRRVKILKSYALDQAKRLYLGTLRFFALRQRPWPSNPDKLKTVTKDLEPSDLSEDTEDRFTWLDDLAFVNRRPDALKIFLAENSKIAVYAQDELLPAASLIADGYKLLLNNEDEKSPLARLNLSNPDPKVKEELAKQVLGAKVLEKLPQKELKRTVGLVTHYLHAVGAIADSFNVNIHDSFELTRAAIITAFRTVVDFDAHEAWRTQLKGPELLQKAVQYRPFPEDPRWKDYRPLRDILSLVQKQRYEIYIKETAKGPKLTAKDDEKRKEEFEVYHGRIDHPEDLIKELFGRDMSQYVWPKSHSLPGDPRFTGDPSPTSKNVQGGYVWGELGPGLGSLLIALSTSPSLPKDKAKNFIRRTNLLSVAKEKVYNRWAGAIRFFTRTMDKIGLEDLGDYVGKTVGITQPGAGVDYNSLSHLGLVESYGDEEYPEFTHVDFSDAFPNRLRQAWKAHGFGFNHARKGMVFKMKNSYMQNYVRTLPQQHAAVKAEIPRTQGKLTEQWNDWKKLDLPSLRTNCRRYFTNENVTEYISDYKGSADAFNAKRNLVRQVYRLCLNVWQEQGMENFEKIQKRVMPNPKTEADYEQLIQAAGEEVVWASHAIRNQLPGYEGYGIIFDEHFDSMTKSSLYCSEFVEFTWRLATGMLVLPEAKFRGSIKLLLKHLPQEAVEMVSSGFLTVPYGENDDVFAPIDVYQSPEGRKVWEVVLEQRRGFFGVNDE